MLACPHTPALGIEVDPHCDMAELFIFSGNMHHVDALEVKSARRCTEQESWTRPRTVLSL
eukprot:scaffold294182_cov33-Tisochrysis_lutea.AAC.5